jgi:acetyl esterase
MIATEDIVYSRNTGPDLLARIYRAGEAAPCPALIDVHGGAWVSGSRLDNASLAESLAARGIVVASIDFRSGTEARYPASVADANLAVRWLKANAVQFGSQPNMIGILGTSSGAHQALLTAIRPHDSAYTTLIGPSGVDASVRFVVACWPISDPLARYHMAKQKQLDHLLQGHETYFGSEAQMAIANPQLILERGEAQTVPPLLIIQGTADENVTPDMAERLAAAYRKAGGRAELRQFDRQPHIFALKQPESQAAQAAIHDIVRFIKAHAVDS